MPEEKITDNNNENLLLQSYNLICKYANNSLPQCNKEQKQEFISEASCIVFKHVIDNFDPTKGTLGTYVYMVLNYHKKSLVYSITHNVSLVEARRLYRLKNENNDDAESALVNILFPQSIDEINNNDYDSYGGDYKIGLEFIDDTIDIEKDFDSVELLSNIKVLLKKYRTNKRNKQIIEYWLDNLSYITMEEIGKKFNLTRQRVSHIILQFRKYVKNKMNIV